MYKTCFITYH